MFSDAKAGFRAIGAAWAPHSTDRAGAGGS